MVDRPRTVFAMEASYCNDQQTTIAVTITGPWDPDLLDAVSDFISRRRKRLSAQKPKNRGPLICDGWDLL